jgi:hypothetical protein
MTLTHLETERPAESQGKPAKSERQGRRVEISCRMFFFGDEEFEGEATVLDVSKYGCRATSRVEVKIGMALQLSLFLSDYKWPLQVDQSIVRWVDGERFGLEFTEIRLAQRDRLRSLIMKSRA